jgi:hypothetical protein
MSQQDTMQVCFQLVVSKLGSVGVACVRNTLRIIGKMWVFGQFYVLSSGAESAPVGCLVGTLLQAM